MTERKPKPKRHWGCSLLFGITLGLTAVALVSYFMFAISFLSVTKRVDADVLVVESWIPYYMFQSAAGEFHRGHYALLLISGQQNNPDREQTSSVALESLALHFEELGVPRSALITCPAQYSWWHRTAKTAKVVREKTHELGLKPRGINILTEGTHARETWAAYRHIYGNETPIGIISIPKIPPPSNRWWLSRGGIFWISKDFFGWLKEIIFPLYS